MTETKTFDARVVGSVTSGITMILPFSLIHEAIAWIAGHEVWTHELGAVQEAIVPDLLLRFPNLPANEEAVEALGWEKCAADLLAKYPNGIELEKGSAKRTRHPAQTTLIARATGGSAAP